MTLIQGRTIVRALQSHERVSPITDPSAAWRHEVILHCRDERTGATNYFTVAVTEDGGGGVADVRFAVRDHPPVDEDDDGGKWIDGVWQEPLAGQGPSDAR